LPVVGSCSDARYVPPLSLLPSPALTTSRTVSHYFRSFPQDRLLHRLLVVAIIVVAAANTIIACKWSARWSLGADVLLIVNMPVEFGLQCIWFVFSSLLCSFEQ
jgi:hypothetical protein